VEGGDLSWEQEGWREIPAYLRLRVYDALYLVYNNPDARLQVAGLQEYVLNMYYYLSLHVALE